MAASSATANNPNPSSAGGGGAGGKDGESSWLTSIPGIPDELKSNPSFTRYKTPDTFLRSHLALEKKLGEREKDLVRVPGPEATDEERNEFYSKLGRPEAPDKYELELPGDEEFVKDEKFINAARAEFHKLGLNNTQAKAMATFYVSQQKAALEAMRAELQGGVEHLKQEWGHAFERNTAVASRAVEQLAGDIAGLSELMEDPRWGANPTMVRLFNFLGQAMGEDTAIDGETRVDAKAQEEMKSQIDDIRRNPKNPEHEAFHDANHPMHRKTVEKVDAMYKEIYGEEPIGRPRQA